MSRPKAIHEPWVWADKQRVTLNYPRPIVDHKQARVALAAEAARKFERMMMKNSEGWNA